MEFIELRFGQSGLEDDEQNVQREIVPVDSILDVYINLPEKKIIDIVFRTGTGKTCHRKEYFRNEIECLKRYLGISRKLKARADRLEDGIVFCSCEKHAEAEEKRRVEIREHMDAEAKAKVAREARRERIMERLTAIHETPYMVRAVETPLYFNCFDNGEPMAAKEESGAMWFKAKEIADKACIEISKKYSQYKWEIVDMRKLMTAEERLLWAIFGEIEDDDAEHHAD